MSSKRRRGSGDGDTGGSGDGPNPSRIRRGTTPLAGAAEPEPGEERNHTGPVEMTPFQLSQVAGTCPLPGCSWSSANSWALSTHVAKHRKKLQEIREVRHKRRMMKDHAVKKAEGPFARPLHRKLVPSGTRGGLGNIRDVVLHAGMIGDQVCGDSCDDRAIAGELHASGPLDEDSAPFSRTGARRADKTDALDEEGVARLDVADASPNDLLEAAKELLIAMTPKIGRSPVDRLLRVMLHENWGRAASSLRVTGASSVKDLVAESERTLHEDLKLNGFSREIVRNPRGTDLESTLEVYKRSPLQVLKNQLERASADRQNFFFDPLDERNRSNIPVHRHPMSGKVVWEGYEAVKTEVMGSVDVSTTWEDGESFVCFLQLYSDVSCMSLKTSAFSFYPLHISVLNFLPSEREAAIRKGHTVTAYLPTAKLWPSAEQTRVLHEGKFTSHGEPLTTYEQNEDSERGDPCFRTGRSAPRQSHEILAESLALCLQEVRETAKKGLVFRDSDGRRRKAHLAIASHVADTPEVICVLCLVGGHCPRCKISKEDMWIPGQVRHARTSSDTEETLSEYEAAAQSAIGHTGKASQRKAIAEAERVIESQGLTSRLPSSFEWPFSRVHPGLDPYRIMRVDFMHTFPLGLQKEILNLSSKRLRSENLHTTVFKTAVGKEKTFKSIRRTVLSEANGYLRRIEEEAPSVGLHVDFSRGKAATATDGLFAETGIASMLEAKDLKNIAQVMPFLGALMDRLCGFRRNGSPVTSVFVKYVELEQTIMRRGMDETGFTGEELSQLHEQIRLFKKETYDVFKEYQASGFKFPKWHSIEHLARDIEDLGVCSNFSADAFEYSHTVFKACNRGGSQRRTNALEETTGRLAAAEVRGRRLEACELLSVPRSAPGKSTEGCTRDGSDEECHRAAPDATMVRYLVTGRKPETLTVTRGVGYEATVSDACALATTRSRSMSTNFGEVAAAVEEVASRIGPGDCSQLGSSNHGKHPVSLLPASKQFIAAVGGYALAKKILDILQTNHGGAGSASLMRLNMSIVKSARVAGFPCPTLEDVVEMSSGRSEIFLQDTGHRVSQKIISALSYSGRPAPLQDNVIVEGDEPVMENTNEPPRRHMWVAKVLLFLTLSGRDEVSRVLPDTSGYPGGREGGEEEVAVVRYYEVIPRRDLDLVDVTLCCIRLAWAMDVDHEEPWVDVIPASSIRGRVHVVPVFDGEAERTTPSGSKTAGSSDSEDGIEDGDGREAVFSGSRDWKARQFYINRFRKDPRDTAYHVVDRRAPL